MRNNKGRFIKGTKSYGKYPKNGEDRNCEHCGKTFYAKRRDILKGWGRFCSHECWYKNPRSEDYREKLARWQRGKDSQHWLGGFSNSLKKTYGAYKWQILRERVFERDNYTCQKCGKEYKQGGLDCHHIIPHRIGIKQKFIYWNVGVNDLCNLISLCKSCHKITDNENHKKEKEGTYGITPILHLVA